MSASRRLNLSDEPVVRICTRCGRRIPKSQDGQLCRECLKAEVFPSVKKYIRENPDVNEMMVADKFELDRNLVHEWVLEGRLEYKNK